MQDVKTANLNETGPSGSASMSRDQANGDRKVSLMNILFGIFPKILEELKETYRFRFVTLTFINFNLRLRYRRSVFGFLWTVLAPFLQYAVMGYVFSIFARGTVPNFFVFYFTGAVFFSLFANSFNRAPTMLIGAEYFITKIYLPKFVFVLNHCLLELVNFCLAMTALIFLGNFFGRLDISWFQLLAPIPVFFGSIFVIGMSCILSVATVYFRDLLNIIPVIIQALFFATPIFFRMEDLPERAQFYFQFNPLNFYVRTFRDVVMYERLPTTYDSIMIVSLALGSLLLGLIVLKLFDNKIVFKL